MTESYKCMTLRKQLQPRSLFIFDFFCALAVGVIYFLLFDFIIETLALPRWVVQTQLLANFLYGIYGAILFTRRTKRQLFFRFLVVMNFIYASFCVAVGLTLSLNGIYGGALLLLVEGIFIATLAKLEWSSMVQQT